jgi:hypothetical protein
LSRRPGRRLVAHHPDRFGGRPDEDKARSGDGFGEARILGQKAIARMDRAGAGLARGSNDRINVQIALAGGRRSDMDRFVGKMHRQAIFVRIAEHSDGPQIEFLCGADDPYGDLAAIGD